MLYEWEIPSVVNVIKWFHYFFWRFTFATADNIVVLWETVTLSELSCRKNVLSTSEMCMNFPNKSNETKVWNVFLFNFSLGEHESFFGRWIFVLCVVCYSKLHSLFPSTEQLHQNSKCSRVEDDSTHHKSALDASMKYFKMINFPSYLIFTSVAGWMCKYSVHSSTRWNSILWENFISVTFGYEI